MKLLPRSPRPGFTLVEVLVSMSVLSILLVLIMQLFNSAALVIGMGNKHMDTDSQSRALLDRMSIDIGAMVKRADVDYYLKGRPIANNQPGDDQLAFYSEVTGYSPTSSTPSPVSLVAYRKNTTTFKIERLGKGLLWNAASTADTPVVFLPIPLASPLPSPLPSPTPATAPAPAWPQAADATATDVDYEEVGSNVFRFEYYYLLKGQSALSSIVSDVPWDVRAPLNHTSINGLQDVAAIGVAIAVIDPKSRVLAKDAALTKLAGEMKDFASTMQPGDLEAQWQKAVNDSTLPRLVSSAIRIYGRTFYLNSPTSHQP